MIGTYVRTDVRFLSFKCPITKRWRSHCQQEPIPPHRRFVAGCGLVGVEGVHTNARLSPRARGLSCGLYLGGYSVGRHRCRWVARKGRYRQFRGFENLYIEERYELKIRERVSLQPIRKIESGRLHVKIQWGNTCLPTCVSVYILRRVTRADTKRVTQEPLAINYID